MTRKIDRLREQPAQGEGVPPNRGTALSRERLSAAKRTFVTRNVDLSRARRLATDRQPRAGDLVLARVSALGHHQRFESTEGRRGKLYVGDEVILAFGNRYAPDQFEAVVPETLGSCSMVAGGGLAARVLERHAGTRRATAIEPQGLLCDAEGATLNLDAFALPVLELVPDHPALLAVAGTSMNAGKTTTAATLIHGLSAAGLNVAAAKVTGTGSGGDLFAMRDAGARTVLDFTDAGHASTCGLDAAELEQVAITLVAHLAAQRPDAMVIEIADGVLQAETAALLLSPSFRAILDGVLFAAGDALSAQGGVRWLQDAGHHVVGVSGLVSASPLASREALSGMTVPVYTLDELADPILAPQLCFSPPARSGSAQFLA